MAQTRAELNVDVGTGYVSDSLFCGSAAVRLTCDALSLRDGAFTGAGANIRLGTTVVGRLGDTSAVFSGALSIFDTGQRCFAVRRNDRYTRTLETGAQSSFSAGIALCTGIARGVASQEVQGQ